MSTLNGYILRQTLGPLFAAVGIALLVLLTERMLRLLDLVLDTGGGLTVLLQMLAFLVPHYMALALPVAFFLGVLLAFSRLHQNHELDALGAAGIGLPRLTVPVILLGIGLALLSAFNFAVGQPYTRYIYRALVHNVSEAAANVYLKERTFMEVDGVTFMAERIWSNSREFARIFIYQETDKGRAMATTAERGSLYVAPKGEQSILLLRGGVRLETPLPGAAQDGGGQAGALEFDQLQVPIDLVGQEGFRPRGEDERELTLVELWRYRNTPPPDTTTKHMLADFHDRIVRALSVLLLPLLAVPCALGPRRTRQSYRIVAGLLILVVYNEVLNFGKAWAATELVSPLVGLWLPFAILTLLSGVLYYRGAFVVPRGGRLWWSPFAALEQRVQALRGSGLTKRRAPERADT